MLRPEKADEPLGTFFRKRWKRIGLPLFFWGAAYVLYDVFINHVSVTWDFAFRIVVTGPYYQFWYIYMLIGLYLATPILRVLIAHISRKMFTYFMTLWLFGVCLQPLWNFIYGHNSSYFLNIATFFVWGGYLGGYLSGAYLRASHALPHQSGSNCTSCVSRRRPQRYPGSARVLPAHRAPG